MALLDEDDVIGAAGVEIKETNIEVCARIRPLLKEDEQQQRELQKKQQQGNGKSKKSRGTHFASRLGSPLKVPRKAPLPPKGGQRQDETSSEDVDMSTVLAWDVAPDNNTVQQSGFTEHIQGRTNSYTLDRVYGPASTTGELYETSVKPVVLSAMEGYHASIFAYGQTSTGKTFTMTGKQGSPGIVPLAVKDCFDYVKLLDESREYLIRVSYLEIYNEQLIDLLNESNSSSIRIMEGKEGVVIRGLREEVVTTPLEVFKYLQKGEMRRQVGSTNMNKHSSRSHAIVRLWMESTSGDGSARISSLNLVDLAGSESVRLTGSTGERKREGQYINKSLMTLGQVVYKLSEKSKTHIPYRNSKLTRFLQPSLSGNAQIVVICNISPRAQHLEESHNTLKFAVRAKKIKQRVTLNRVQDHNTLLQTYREEIADLRAQLAEAKANGSNGDAQSTTSDQPTEELLELAEAIRKMEGLILKTHRKQQKGGEDDELLLTPEPTLLAKELKNGSNASKSSKSSKDDKDDGVVAAMHRIQGLLGEVLTKKSTTNGAGSKQDANRDAEVEELRAQLHEQQVTTNLRKADSSFLQAQLEQKDELLEEASKVLEAVEKRQVQLEEDNGDLIRKLGVCQEEIALLRRELAIVTGERDRLLSKSGSLHPPSQRLEL